MHNFGPWGASVPASEFQLKRLALRAVNLIFGLLVLIPACSAQISPGPLSKAHQSLTGTTQCASCHQFGTSTPTFKCLDCHKEVAQRLDAKHGYHARLQLPNPNGRDCVHCHLEHNGEDFNLIHWEEPQKEFDHRLTGYSLEGKHAAVACEKCHTPAHMASTERELIKMKDLTRSFFGLSQNCVTCHTESAQRAVGQRLPELPQRQRLEAGLAIRSFEDAISANRLACGCCL